MATFKWTVEFTIDESWVADGFDLTEDLANEMIENALPYSVSSELSARVIRKPDAKRIRKVQGYRD